MFLALHIRKALRFSSEIFDMVTPYQCSVPSRCSILKVPYVLVSSESEVMNGSVVIAFAVSLDKKKSDVFFPIKSSAVKPQIFSQLGEMYVVSPLPSTVRIMSAEFSRYVLNFFSLSLSFSSISFFSLMSRHMHIITSFPSPKTSKPEAETVT